ncbi:hypothetical protein FJV80_27370 [Mesorhizobium sp. WSM4310]|uniref:hypothetical protein n=1 Tax=Mesorhizobium sp. WSM4310 TaxID=2589883 RepID=UPI00115CFF52|nr:hypothetical protein [Mesorhizobium sp. WSM4310]TRC75787.1 hypothetical protein FJV80_27370 [Mesorhizobium sp. WSM4310]
MKGELESLPVTPFGRLRLLFLDLHLAGQLGKNAASYTANAFRRIVPTDTAPVVVVIWSKYAAEIVDTDLPQEDQETEAALFRRTLLGAEPAYEGRVIFVEMPKPMPDDRPDNWVDDLKQAIDNALVDQPAIAALWAWDALVKEATSQVTTSLTSAAQTARAGTALSLGDGLKTTLQKLTAAQGEADLSAQTAPFHMTTVLSQLLIDQLELAMPAAELTDHGAWLAEAPNPAPSAAFRAKMNSILLASDLAPGTTPFGPGTVYRVTNDAAFLTAFGKDKQTFIDHCFGKGAASPRLTAWRTDVRPILVEISPVCDVAQNKRIAASLISGLIVPEAQWDCIKTNVPSITELPPFKIRWPTADFGEQDAKLIVAHFFRLSIPTATPSQWLAPWFRLRELPTTSIRNSNSAQFARVGYVSVG